MRQDCAQFETIQLAGIPFANLSRQETASLLLRMAKAKNGVPWFATSANGQVISACETDPAMMRRLQQAHLVSCDGQPIVTLSRWLSRRGLKERVATTDLIHDLCSLSTTVDFTLFILGATDRENKAATESLRIMYPRLKIVGGLHGYHSEQQWPEVVRQINEIGPDLLIVSLGVPHEHAFYEAYASHLPRVGVIKTAGGLLNFLSGSVPRAPKWLQDAGLEWAFRLAREPRRLFFRYLYTNPHALYLLLARRPVLSIVSLNVE